MNNSNIIPMRLEGPSVSDLDRMLEKNHERARIQRHKRRLASRAMIARIVTAVIATGCVAVLAVW